MDLKENDSGSETQIYELYDVPLPGDKQRKENETGMKLPISLNVQIKRSNLCEMWWLKHNTTRPACLLCTLRLSSGGEGTIPLGK